MVNLALIKKEWREHFLKLVICLFIFFAAAFSLPLFLSGNVNNPHFTLNDGNAHAFWYYWISFVIRWLGLIIAVILGMASFASEKMAGTAVFLFSRPLARGTIYHNKMLAGMTMIAICCLLPTILAAATASSQGWSNSLWFSIFPAMAGIYIAYFMTVIFSILSHEPTRAGLISVISLVLLSLPGWLPETRPLSFIYQMQGPSGFAEKAFPWLPFVVMFIFILFLYRLGLYLIHQMEL